jgi:chlorophyll synthase
MFNAGSITWQEVVLTVLYSIAGLGIAIVNDFKSIEGDRALGMNSLPVAFGIEKAKWLCVGTIDVTQLGVAAYLYAIGPPPPPAAATDAAVTDARRRAAHYSAAPPATALSARAATPNHCASRPAGETTYALVLFGLILPQMFAQLTFIQDPVANDVKYQGAAQPFLVFGILTTALAVGHHTF